MSRSIDLSKKLSAEDREYLLTRGRNDLINANDEQFGSSSSEPTPIDDGNTGDVDPFKADDGSDALTGASPDETLPTQIARIEAQGVSDLGDENKDPDNAVTTTHEPSQQEGDGLKASGDDEDGDNYDDAEVWSYDDLKEEVKGRESIDIPLNSKRDELVAALRKDDASSEG